VDTVHRGEYDEISKYLDIVAKKNAALQLTIENLEKEKADLKSRTALLQAKVKAFKGESSSEEEDEEEPENDNENAETNIPPEASDGEYMADVDETDGEKREDSPGTSTATADASVAQESEVNETP